MTDRGRTNDRMEARIGRKTTSAIRAERAKLKHNDQSVTTLLERRTHADRRTARSSLARRFPI